MAKIAKLDDSDRQRILDELAIATDPDQVAELRKELAQAVEDMAAHHGSAAVNGVAAAAGVSADDLEAMLSQSNDLAVSYAARRSGELITAIDETTRTNVRELIGQGIEEGWTNAEFSAHLSDSFTFDGARADMIARTETAFAENAGTLDGWKASGLVSEKKWLPDAEACEICLELGALGPIPLDEDFDTEDDSVDGPPAHPNCECTLIAVLAE